MTDKEQTRNEWSILNCFLQHSTGHGFPKCANTDDNGSVFRRIFWLFVALAFSAVGVLQGIAQVQYYRTLPTVTSIDVVQRKDIQFPSVTVCPLQPIFGRAITGGGTLSNFVGAQLFGSKISNQLEMLLEMNNLLSGRKYTAGSGLSVEDILSSLRGRFNVTAGTKKFLDLTNAIRYTEQGITESGSIWKYDKIKDLELFFDKDIDLNESWNGKFLDFRKYISETHFRNVVPNDHFLNLLTLSTSNFLASLKTQGENVPLMTESQWLRLAVNPAVMGYFQNYINNENSPAYGLLNYFLTLAYLYAKEPFTFNPYEFLKSCKFKDRNCMYSLYTTTEPVLKTCIHFNNEFLHEDNEGFISEMARNDRRQPPKNTSGVGRNDGITFSLTNLMFSSLGFLGPVEGYAVAIGDSATMPRLDQYIMVPNTGSTDLNIQRTEINRLKPEDGGKCANENHYENVFPNQKIVGIYDQSICSQLLVFFRILEECDCYVSNKIMGGIIGIKNITRKISPCSFVMNPCAEYATELANLVTEETCPPACHEVKFDIFATFVPTNSEGVINAHGIQNLQVTQDSCSFDPFVTMVLRVCSLSDASYLNIYYRTKSVQVYQENLVMTPLGLIGNIGGLAGLWVGVSLMSFVELLEVLFDILTFRLCRTRKKPIASQACAAWGEKQESEDRRLLQILQKGCQAMEERLSACEAQFRKPTCTDPLQDP